MWGSTVLLLRHIRILTYGQWGCSIRWHCRRFFSPFAVKNFQSFLRHIWMFFQDAVHFRKIAGWRGWDRRVLLPVCTSVIISTSRSTSISRMIWTVSSARMRSWSTAHQIHRTFCLVGMAAHAVCILSNKIPLSQNGFASLNIAFRTGFVRCRFASLACTRSVCVARFQVVGQIVSVACAERLSTRILRRVFHNATGTCCLRQWNPLSQNFVCTFWGRDLL